jgi:poly(beta-D-mannuronate) lyase
MPRLSFKAIAFCVALGIPAAGEAGWRGLFDVEKRRAELGTSAMRPARAACLAVARDPTWVDAEPVLALRTTDGYGTDRASLPFSWTMMVLSSRALGGDPDARADLAKIIVKWARAGAFVQSETVHDAYYALKRTLLPTIIAYQVIRPALAPRDADAVASWLDRLVRMIDHRFNGDVDRNNHRTLADSVIALWGSVSGDNDLYAIGRRGFDATLAQARDDGSIPLETRRGSRALWYMRQTLGSLTLIAEVAAGRDENLYVSAAPQESGAVKTPLTRVSGYFANTVAEPDLVLPYAAENYIPGPSFAFAEQDLGFSDKRSNGRHYLAFMEAIEARRLEAFPYRRLRRVLDNEAAAERPLIDEFIGGNATCFWRQP